MHAIKAPVVAMWLACVLGAPAFAAVRFDHEVVIAGEDRVKAGAVAVDAPAAGKLDIAWRAVKGQTRYTRWDREQLADRDGKVIDGETVCGLTHYVYGISRDQGVVRIGANNSKRLTEWTRNEDGTWAEERAGVTASNYYGAIGRYDANPQSGLGAFYVVSEKNESVYVAEQQEGGWEVEVLHDNQKPNVRGSFTFTAAGEPVVAYQVLGTPGMVVAGKVGATAIAVGETYVWFPLDVTADPEGGLHLGIGMHTGSTEYCFSGDGGESWRRTRVHSGGSYGDAAAVQIAAGPRGRSLAMLFGDKAGALRLAVSTDGGENWTDQPLPGARLQSAGVAFDSAGALYVVCFDGEAKQLRLLVANTLPAAPGR